jgi:membrane protein implicated in regulation of membrane protease activity
MLPESKRPEEITLFPEPFPGTVEETITSTQAGRVWYQATSWPARLYNSDDGVTLEPKTSVTVVGRQGLTALVEAYSHPEEIINFSQASPGTVEETISPTQVGRIRFQGTSWPARFYNPNEQATVAPDDHVDVIARQGITLFIVPASSPNSVQSPQPESQEDSRAVDTIN